MFWRSRTSVGKVGFPFSSRCSDDKNHWEVSPWQYLFTCSFLMNAVTVVWPRGLCSAAESSQTKQSAADLDGRQ